MAYAYGKRCRLAHKQNSIIGYCTVPMLYCIDHIALSIPYQIKQQNHAMLLLVFPLVFAIDEERKKHDTDFILWYAFRVGYYRIRYVHAMDDSL